MTFNFIKKIVDDNIDNHVHMKFVRFGMGKFEKEQFIVKVTGKNVQIQSGYEYSEVFLRILAENSKDNFDGKGRIVSSKDMQQELSEHNVEVIKKRGNKYDVEFSLSADSFKKFVYAFKDSYLLLNVVSGNNTTKMKQSLPKPNTPVEKFITVKFDKSLLPLIQEEFLFDVEGFKKVAKIKHTYVIESILVDDALLEKDPLKARMEARRKGKVIREIDVDGATETKEYNFIV